MAKNSLKNYTIKVPVKPYIKKWLIAKNGPYLHLSQNSVIGVMTINLLQNGIASTLGKKEEEYRMKFYTESILINASIHYFYKYGFQLCDAAIIQMNRYWEAQFEEDLHFFVGRNVKDDVRKKGYESALELFCKKNNIELDEDISFEGLKKMEYRFRKKTIETTSQIVPNKFTAIQIPMFN